MFSGWGLVSWLGWSVPLTVVGSGQRYRLPGRGVCSSCLDSKPKVYILGDGHPLCSECIDFVLANPECSEPTDSMKREQRHPEVPTAGIPYELRYDIIAPAISDGADLRVYEAAFR